jgi:hypothetical protein
MPLLKDPLTVLGLGFRLEKYALTEGLLDGFGFRV